jgi:hypothetical protein
MSAPTRFPSDLRPACRSPRGGASCPACGVRAAAVRDQRQFRCAVACAAKECIRRMSRPASRAGSPGGGPVHLPPSARALGDSLVSSPSSASARRLPDPRERNLPEVVAARSRGYRPRVTLRVTSPTCWPCSRVADRQEERLVVSVAANERPPNRDLRESCCAP